MQTRAARYDKGGEEHFNIISALHKSMRNSDPQAAVYWLARMLESGEDPLYVARRIVRFASEDVGLADPDALGRALAARDAVHQLGLPEGALALAQAAVYLALAPKSNALYRAYGDAAAEVARGANPPVPAAPAQRADPADERAGLRRRLCVRSRHAGRARRHELPARPNWPARRFYAPGRRGFEAELAERLERIRLWHERRRARRPIRPRRRSARTGTMTKRNPDRNDTETKEQPGGDG